MKRKRVTKADLKTTAGRYLIARHKGKNKTEASLEVGIDPRNSSHLESSQLYQALEKRYFKDEFQDILSVRELAEELKKNVVQDEDRGAKNVAIKIALEKLEPGQILGNQEEERVFVVIK